jgi:hypothetical protein
LDGHVGEELLDNLLLGPGLGGVVKLYLLAATAFLTERADALPTVRALDRYMQRLGNAIVFLCFNYLNFSLFTWKEAIDEDNPPVIKVADTATTLGEFLSLYVHQAFSASSSSCFA